jgi:hypothetical protein
MDRSTQENAALVEEAAAAAGSLQDQAARLAQVVGRFRLGESMAAAPVARAVVRAPAPAPKRIARPAPAPTPRARVRKEPAAAATASDWEEF